MWPCRGFAGGLCRSATHTWPCRGSAGLGRNARRHIPPQIEVRAQTQGVMLAQGGSSAQERSPVSPVAGDQPCVQGVRPVDHSAHHLAGGGALLPASRASRQGVGKQSSPRLRPACTMDTDPRGPCLRRLPNTCSRVRTTGRGCVAGAGGGAAGQGRAGQSRQATAGVIIGLQQRRQAGNARRPSEAGHAAHTPALEAP